MPEKIRGRALASVSGGGHGARVYRRAGVLGEPPRYGRAMRLQRPDRRLSDSTTPRLLAVAATHRGGSTSAAPHGRGASTGGADRPPFERPDAAPAQEPASSSRAPARADPQEEPHLGQRDDCSCSPTTPGRYTYRLPFVIAASAAGTIIEWYDFYLYGVLAAFFCTQFFPPGNDTAALLASLATFGAGFAVRPVRRRRLRPDRRHHRPQVHVPRDDHRHGRLDGPRRRPADLRPDRHPRPDHPGHPPPRPGPRAGRRVRRRGDLRRRAQRRTRSAARTRAGSRPRRRSACCSPSWSSPITRLSMSAEDFTACGWRIPFLLSAILVAARPVHPAPAAGDAAVQRAQGAGQVVDVAVARELRRPAQPRSSSCSRCSARRPARPSSGTRASSRRCSSWARTSACKFTDAYLIVGHGDRPRDAVLPRVRAPVGSDRPQADHPRRLPDRGDHAMSRSTT